MTPVVLHVGASQTLDSVVFHQLCGLRAGGWDVVVACPDDPWAQRLKEHGFALHATAMGRRPSIGAFAGGARDIVRAIRRVRPELIHTHNAHHGLVGRLAAATGAIPAVHTWRYNPLDATDRRAVRAAFAGAEAVASRLGDAVLFQNTDDLREATGSGLVPAERAVLVGNGIRTDLYRTPPEDRAVVRRRIGVGGDVPVVCCVARLEERKRQGDVIDALGIARRTLPDLELLLVGAGPDEPMLRRRAVHAGVGAAVRFLGNRDDVASLLHASDALVLASRREGVPRSVMEAMAARVPVVATDVVGTREVARDGATALVVPFGAVDALAGALVRIVDDRPLAQQLAAAASRLVEEEWREDQVVARVARAYRRVLAEYSRPAARASTAKVPSAVRARSKRSSASPRAPAPSRSRDAASVQTAVSRSANDG